MLLSEPPTNTSHPLFESLSQSAKPGLQAKLHSPALQVALALNGALQAVPQLPQLFELLVVSTQTPEQQLPLRH